MQRRNEKNSPFNSIDKTLRSHPFRITENSIQLKYPLNYLSCKLHGINAKRNSVISKIEIYAAITVVFV